MLRIQESLRHNMGMNLVCNCFLTLWSRFQTNYVKTWCACLSHRWRQTKTPELTDVTAIPSFSKCVPSPLTPKSSWQPSQSTLLRTRSATACGSVGMCGRRADWRQPAWWSQWHPWSPLWRSDLTCLLSSMNQFCAAAQPAVLCSILCGMHSYLATCVMSSSSVLPD